MIDAYLCWFGWLVDWQELFGIDGVPDPVTISAVLHACRRVNDHSLAVRFMETLKYKCGGKVKEIYPYLLQEIQPTLQQLGISTPEGIALEQNVVLILLHSHFFVLISSIFLQIWDTINRNCTCQTPKKCILTEHGIW